MEANSVFRPITSVYQEYRHLITGDKKVNWKRSVANELGQLDQGIRTIKGTNTMFFIPKHEVPFTTKKCIYGKIVCDIKPDKVETHRTRLKVGGNLLEYSGVLSTLTATVTTTKFLLNSIIYTIIDK